MLHTASSRSAPDADQLLSVVTVPGPRRGRVIVQVAGEVDAYTVPLLEACLQSQATGDGLRELVVDLRRVTFIGAAGARALSRARELCRSRGVRLRIRTGDRGPVGRHLQMMGLADLVPVDPDGAEHAGPRSPRTRGRRGAGLRRPSEPRGRRVC